MVFVYLIAGNLPDVTYNFLTEINFMAGTIKIWDEYTYSKMSPAVNNWGWLIFLGIKLKCCLFSSALKDAHRKNTVVVQSVGIENRVTINFWADDCLLLKWNFYVLLCTVLYKMLSPLEPPSVSHPLLLTPYSQLHNIRHITMQ